MNTRAAGRAFSCLRYKTLIRFVIVYTSKQLAKIDAILLTHFAASGNNLFFLRILEQVFDIDGPSLVFGIREWEGSLGLRRKGKMTTDSFVGIVFVLKMSSVESFFKGVEHVEWDGAAKRPNVNKKAFDFEKGE